MKYNNIEGVRNNDTEDKTMKNNRIVCFLLTIIMIATFAIGAIAEETESERATIRLSVDEMALSDLMGWNEEGVDETAKAIANVMNSLQVKYVKAGMDAEIGISLDGEPITGAAFLLKDESMQVISNLFPKYALEVPVLNAVEEINTDELVKPVTKLYEDILQNAGDPESVTEYILGNTFTSRRKVNLTTKELFERVILAEKSILESPSFKSLAERLESTGIKNKIPNLETIAGTLKEEGLPQTEVYIYSDQAGNQIVQVDALKDLDLFNINIGNVNGSQVFEVEGLESYYFYAEISPVRLAIMADMDTNSMNKYISIKVNADISEDKKKMKASAVLSVNDRECIEAALDYEKGAGELSGNYTVAEKETIAMDALNNPQNEAYAGFMVDLLTGLTNVIKGIIEHAPEIEPVLQTLFPQN